MIETAVTSARRGARGADTTGSPARHGINARAVVGIVPALERSKRARLLDALERMYPVRFEAREPGAYGGLDGLLVFGDSGPAAAAETHGISCLIFGGRERRGEGRTVALADEAALSRPLRGARLSESHASGFGPIPVASGEVVLARIAGSPAWALRASGGVRRYRSAIAPDELASGEALRNRLAPGRCLAVLALAEFVRDVTAPHRWEVPAPRAAFVIDDPNLRWPTYGHIDFAELSSSAARHSYHVAIGMVPLDGRPAHPRAVRLFHERRAHLSLCIHGNDHDGPELGRPHSLAKGLAPVAQALRRSLAFERRTGLAVDRVMVAPHEQISESAMAALLACGYEAISGARPYSWINSSPDLPWLTRPPDADPLIGSRSAELMPGGFPLLLRMDFGHPREELVIRAYLGQPVIVYGHHELLAHGPELLEAVAAEISRLGDVRWSSLAGIARGAIETRRTGELLELKMLGRRVCFEVPPGITELQVDTAMLAPASQSRLLVRGPGLDGTIAPAADGARLTIAHPGAVELRLDGALDPASVPAPRRRLAPVARRIVSEGRDRWRHVAFGG